MDLITQLKIFEGTKEYQKYIGYYRNGRFQVYKDHLCYPTIGYGHLIKKGESFPNGLTDEEAEALLIKDIAIAENDYRTLNLNLPSVSRWHDFMIMMLFQVGLTKTRGFKKALQALRDGRYNDAIAEFKNSNWYRQTPNRVNEMISYVTKG
ncbi:lysozyme [Salmonella enterica]|nr:lysozyme [Salmonella enterica]